MNLKTNILPFSKPVNLIISVVIVFALWSYFAGLSVDVTRDAGKYATVAKEMFVNGDYINLTIHGDAYDQKPPMMFWLGALGFSIGGISNFWFKFPMLLLVFAGFYWAFRLGKSLYNQRVGILTAIFLVFSTMYMLYSMDIHADTPLQAFVTLALWQLFEFLKTGKLKNWFWGFTAIGLAMLSKGPIGAAIPAFAVVGHLLLKKDFRRLFDWHWYAGVVLAFTVASPALIGLMNQFGWGGIRFFFWENNIGRITGTYVKAQNDPIFYIHNLLFLFLPWVLMFFVSLFYETRSLVKSKFQSGEYFTFTGFWVFFLILSASKNQSPNYIFAVFPLLAVLTAKWTDLAVSHYPRLVKIFYRIQIFITGLIWTTIFIFLFYLFPLPALYFWPVLVITISATVYLYLKANDKLIRLILPSVLIFSTLMVLLNTHIFPFIFSHQAPPVAARFYSQNHKPGEKLYNYKYGQYELFFYSEPQAVQLKNETEIKKAAAEKGSWIFTDPEGMKEIEDLGLKPELVINYKHLYLNRGGRFINPKTRDKVLQPMFLLYFVNQ